MPCMKSTETQKQSEILIVSFADTGADPRTVMVMHFYTRLADVTMERSGRSDQVTCLTIGKGEKVF